MIAASPYTSAAAADWPSIWQWLSRARGNGLDLFPEEAYRRLRIDRSVFGRQLVVLSDPDAISHVCGRGSGRYRLSNLQQRLLRPALGDGLTVAEGRSWALQRKLAGRLMPNRLGDTRAAAAQARIDAALDELGAGDSTVSARALTDGLVALSIDLIAQVCWRSLKTDPLTGAAIAQI